MGGILLSSLLRLQDLGNLVLFISDDFCTEVLGLSWLGGLSKVVISDSEKLRVFFSASSNFLVELTMSESLPNVETIRIDGGSVLGATAWSALRSC